MKKNYYELIEMIKNDVNTDVLRELLQDMQSEYINELDKIQINNTTRKNAINNYLKHSGVAQCPDTSAKLFCDGVSVIGLNGKNDYEITQKNPNIKKVFDEIMKHENRRPIDDIYFKGCIAIAKANGWNYNTTKKYYIEIDGNYYDFYLVLSVWGCIADKSGERCELVNINNTRYRNKKGLLISTEYGIGYILPVFTESVYKPLLCDFRNYMNFRNDIDDFIINQAKRGA